MNCFKNILYILLFLSSTYALAAELRPAPTGYDDFLVNNKTIEVVLENTQAKIFPGGHDEKYWAHDTLGNLYKLRLKNSLPNYAEIGASILIDLMGAPNLPVYPILLKRGMNCVPTVQEAKLLAPSNEKMGLAGSKGEWFQATIQGAVKLQKFESDNLSGKQLAELIAQLIANYVVGNNDNALGDGSEGNLGFDGVHFYTLDATQSFKDYADEGQPEVQVAFYQAYGIFTQVLNNLSAAQILEFVQNLNNYLTRLEQIQKADLEPALGHYFTGINSYRKFKHLAEFDFWKELFRRARVARMGVVNVLDLRGLDPMVLNELKTRSQVAQVKLVLPTLSLREASIPSTNDHCSSDLTWAFYFQDFWKKRNEALAKWGLELSTSADLVIPAVQNLKK